MTKIPCGKETNLGDRNDRSFFTPEFTALRPEIAWRIIGDELLRPTQVQDYTKKYATVALSIQAINERLLQLEDEATIVSYHAKRFPGSGDIKLRNTLPYPPLLRLEDESEIKARRILFSLATDSEVETYFKDRRNTVIPTPLVIGAQAVALFKEYYKEKETTTSPLYVAA